MTDQGPSVENQSNVARIATPKANDAADKAALPINRPYLQIFGPDIGVFEFYLPDGTITIGRSEHANIRLPHHTVSRVHATMVPIEGGYLLEDANSNYGTTVNKKRVDTHTLRHGDSIQISLYVLQFRTHPTLPGAAEAAARAKLMLRSEFCLLPSTMRLKFRKLVVDPREIFRRGDTLRIGHGGLLIPTPSAEGFTASLELQLLWPTGQSKRYLGEILGVFPAQSTNWMCVKLHTVPKDIHKVIVAAAEAGQWMEVTPT
jgi:hypothetical protein